MDEPEAAAITYKLDLEEDEENILVFNIERDNFDISLSSVDNYVFESYNTFY